MCAGSILELDGNKQEGLLLEEIARLLKLNHSNAPRRPPRIILLGPPGCGKTELALKVAQKYKVTYVKVAHIIKDYLRDEAKRNSLTKEQKKQ